MSAHKNLFTPVNSLIPLLAACLTFGSYGVAAAGGAGPEEEACSGRAVGDACSLPNRQLGTCGSGTCSRLDYSGGSPPKSIEEPCIVCQPAGDQAGHDNPPPLGSGGAPPDSGGDGDDASESAPTSSGSTNNSRKEPPQSSSRCRVDPDVGGLGTLGLLGIFGLSGVALRRRRRS